MTTYKPTTPESLGHLTIDNKGRIRSGAEHIGYIVIRSQAAGIEEGQEIKRRMIRCWNAFAKSEGEK